MKRKLLVMCAFAGMGTLATAQTTMVKNDRGQIVTPEAGDWALGMNAAPILNYVGNMFNGNTNNGVGGGSFVSGTSIFGKYFVNESTAFRGTLGIGAGRSSSTFNYGGLSGDSLTNTRTISGLPISLSFGIEKRKGHGRLQGYYGGEVMIGASGSANTKFDYAVPFEQASLTAGTLVDFNGTVLSASDSRVSSIKGGKTFMFGVRGFVGVEYFVAPKFSIGAEYGLALNFATNTEQIATSDRFNGTTPESFETIAVPKSNLLSFATDNFSGAIRLMYHF